MSAIQDKIMFGFATLCAAVSAGTGAHFTAGETRWFFVTLASSFLMSGFLALMCKKPEETIQLVVGRCGFAVMGGILATKPVVHFMGLAETTMTDAVDLAGASAGVCFVTFFVGFDFLRIVESQAPEIAQKWFKKLDP